MADLTDLSGTGPTAPTPPAAPASPAGPAPTSPSAAPSALGGPAPTSGPAPEIAALVDQVAGVVLGERGPLHLAVAAFLAGGHVLLEDIPGVGKTLLAKSLARSLGGSFGRVQGTADLLPSDLTGVSVYDDATRDWTFRPGPLFNNVVLVDELNRATPRTQSALLEAMAESQVTVDGDSYHLPGPFFVIATQNPHGDLGTFPLVAGQRDRFAVSVSLGLPGREAERRLVAGAAGDAVLDTLRPVASIETWTALRARVDDVFVHPIVGDYALDLCDVVRSRAGRDTPLSTRAALSLVRVARAHALVDGRRHVTPDDVQAVAPASLAHRLLDATNGDLFAARSWVFDFLGSLPVPPTPER